MFMRSKTQYKEQLITVKKIDDSPRLDKKDSAMAETEATSIVAPSELP